MTPGLRLLSDGSARCLATSAAQPRAPYVRVAGCPLRAGAGEQRESGAERATEPGRPRCAPSPAESRVRLESRRADQEAAPSTPRGTPHPHTPLSAAASGIGGELGWSCTSPTMRAGLRGSSEQHQRGGYRRLGSGASR